MKSLFPLNRIFTVLNTSYTGKSEVALPFLKVYVSGTLEAKVNGLLVPALASEVFKLTPGERIKFIEETSYNANDGIPVFTSLGEMEINRGRELMISCLSFGCKNILYPIALENKNQFNSHFLNLADLQSNVIKFQDRNVINYGLSDQLNAELFDEIKAFKYLKIEKVAAGINCKSIHELIISRYFFIYYPVLAFYNQNTDIFIHFLNASKKEKTD